MRLLPVFFVVIFAWLAACTGGGKRDIRAYYFPVENLRRGMVYEYEVAQNDSISPEYWYYRAFLRDSGQFLTGTYYDHRFQIGQIIREKITPTGALARECHLYEPDATGEGQLHTRAQIESPNVFPFGVTDSLGVFLFRLKFRPPEDSAATVYVIRNRRFLGDAPDFEFRDKKFPCVKFALREAIGSEKEGAAELEGVGEEWYAKGLGLVYYCKTYSSGGFKIEARLADVFPMAELERRALEVYGEE
jgi:hypothetical protein